MHGVEEHREARGYPVSSCLEEKVPKSEEHAFDKAAGQEGEPECFESFHRFIGIIVGGQARASARCLSRLVRLLFALSGASLGVSAVCVIGNNILIAL